MNINNPYGFGQKATPTAGKNIFSPSIAEPKAHAASKPSEVKKAFEAGFDALKEIGKKSDDATKNFANGMGNVTQVAFDTATWHALIEVSAATQQKIVGAVDQIMKTPL
ncbi:MAG TPA: hypothetical protein VI959_02605 [Alphaproteobacteria bacterium]|nr:hypothetical protein [Alphaproteobacteria bacterium]